MPRMLTIAIALFCLLLSSVFVILLCQQYINAADRHKLHSRQALLAADSLAGKRRIIDNYRQLQQRASQLHGTGMLGAAISTSVKEIQQLAAQMQDAGYRFSSLPDRQIDGAVLQRAAIEFNAVLQDMEGFIYFAEKLIASNAGAFMLQHCNLTKGLDKISFSCGLEWFSVKQSKRKLEEY
ncbi:MAG: hypothetical protein ACNYPG_01025 [Candidatus Porifericomitaceae bacterium WSBS_2022_MAG_OTU9]